MVTRSRFVIRNDLPRTAILNIEPEGAFVPLVNGEEMSVIDVYTTDPVTITLGQSTHGDPIISLWPGDGEVRVERDGVDVLDREIVVENKMDTSSSNVILISKYSERAKDSEGAERNSAESRDPIPLDPPANLR